MTFTGLDAPAAEALIPGAGITDDVVAASSQRLPAQSPPSSLNRGVTMVARTVLSPLSVTGTPEAPAQSPALWALLAAARREFDQAASEAGLKRGDLSVDRAIWGGPVIVKPGADVAPGGNVPASPSGSQVGRVDDQSSGFATGTAPIPAFADSSWSTSRGNLLAWQALNPASRPNVNVIHDIAAEATDVLAGAVNGFTAQLPADWSLGATASLVPDVSLLRNLTPMQRGDMGRGLIPGAGQIRDWALSLVADDQAVEPSIFDRLGILAAVPSLDPQPFAAGTPTFTGQPSVVERLFVGGLRLINPILRMAGIELTGSSASIPFISDGTPPFFLTYGLTVSSGEYDGWKVWTLTPANPSGKVVVAVHGGAFVSQVNIFQWWTYTDMARDTGATVVVPLYPLANAEGTGGTAKTVVPTMADFIADQVAEHGAGNVSVLGDSVGGTIALAAAQELVRRCNGDEACLSQTLPGHMVLISPFLDLSMSNPNIALVDDPLLSADSSRNYAKLWAAGLGTPDDPDGTKNPLASPLYGSLEGLPPTTVYTGSLDMRAPDVLLLQQLAAATPGTDFEFELRNGAIHDWVIFAFLPDAVAERPGMYEHLGIAGTTEGDNA
ncbi:alpha/beta hydrolase fold domain-containing protein [Mycolicibacterium sp. HK-90]|uniref:alpha/beta hydrolase fold domain-containing protein n=1 Tax=Mycolicibacterium sp. HK-90 TaxID=3056937 RepID=UPI002658867A|nr:alpha/beta hydrolase [Mycolicibacterium sp. HK-90]WKG04024.1 alpha/beta hydrolase [Mycolicibacterium sp. HK-90]